ncbi:MAG: metallophosphoesterase [Phycisphaeraceae bacterium]|nr:MAG: metallophosphoesterase [Phycisphaeraceae bacterium]
MPIHPFVPFAALSVAVVAHAFPHPDTTEPGLLSHWAVGSHAIENGTVEEVGHALKATVQGAPSVVTIGPAQGWSFNGMSDFFMIADDFKTARASLPTRAMTVSAWVNLASTRQWGSITSVIQDNGDAEAGWILGYNEKHFSFGLSTAGADDGNGKMTYLSGSTPIQSGLWYHVAGVYDGTTMRLFVNGQLDGVSTEQSGDILYPDAAPYTIACYLDRDERHALEGVVHRVKVYDRALRDRDLAAEARKNQNMIDFRPSPESTLAWLVAPYLQFATLDSIVVMSETERPAATIVEFGERQPFTGRVELNDLTPIGEARLTGLKPQTTYFYRVTRTAENGAKAVSPILSFQTAVPADRAWAFGIIGDTQRNPTVTRKCAEGIFNLRPNMVIHLGDVVDDGFAKNQWLQDLFEPMSGLLAHVPMYPVIGNHEKNSQMYYDYFSLPTPEYYYTFTYGNAQFFMIDTNKDCAPGSEQYQWLDQQLGSSTATWKFAAHHHPCFSSDIDDYGDTERGDPTKVPQWGDRRAKHLIDLYEKHGVDIVFNGHIHVYERTWPLYKMSINMDKGVRYITSGGGGGGLEKAAHNRTWFSLHFANVHHYCYATLFDGTIQFKAYDIEGRMLDTFELTKPANR